MQEAAVSGHTNRSCMKHDVITRPLFWCDGALPYRILNTACDKRPSFVWSKSLRMVVVPPYTLSTTLSLSVYITPKSRSRAHPALN